METSNSLFGRQEIKLVIWIGGLVIAACVVFGLVAHRFGDWALLNQFGGAFTVLGAAFSGLAFAAIFVALKVQVEQLRVQREELEKTREQSREQRKAFDEQQFENKFFELLKIFINGVDSINTGNRYVQRIGNDWFTQFRASLANAVQEARTVEQVRIGYEQVYNELAPVLTRYFQNLGVLLRFVDERALIKPSSWT